MDPDQIKALIEAIKNQDGAAALQIAEAMLVSAAGGGAASVAPPPDGASTEAADPVPPPPGAPPVAPAKASALTKDQKEIELMRVQLAALTAERDDVELAARQELVGELVKLGAETPATAWLNADKKIPAKRFSLESVKELRTRVAALAASKPKTRELHPPVSDDAEEIAKLSKYEIAECKKQGIDLADYIVRKANATRRI